VQAIGPTGNEGSFNPPAWSISVEFYTYVIFALIVLLAGRFKLIAFACLGALSFGLLLPGHDALGFGNLLMCTTGFSLGCLTASLTQRRKLELPAYAPLLALLLLAAYLQFKAVNSLDLLIFPLSALVIIAVVYARDGIGRIVLTWRPFVWLGMVSYSLYLSHHATIWILGQAFRFIWKRPEVLIGARTVPQLSTIEALAAYPVFVAASLCVGWFTYKLIEKPFRERSRKIAGVA
jgi:peptidoglycan/LPS O-acetylase OafA/YrhL